MRLQLGELFRRPSKKIPGEWKLYEYYIDVKDELLHFNEEALKDNNNQLELEFGENGAFDRKAILPVSLMQNLNKGSWSVAKNFITIIDPSNFRNNVEFQFAFEKGNLKLLKKDAFGKIEFFGFFKKPKTKA